MALVICSSFMHASWNLMARRHRSEAAFFNRMLVAIVALGFLPAVVSEALAWSLTPKAWACVAGSGVCCGVYYLGLARAYGASDFTVVYPLVRALPILLVGLGDVLRGRYPSPMGWLGIVLVTFGCFFAPLHSLREITISKYLNRASVWMLLTALGTVGYSLLDKVASEVVHQGPATAARYCYVFFLFAFLAYAAFLRAFQREGPPAKPVGWALPALGGCLDFVGYWLILWAYQLTQHASYVVAFRQLSIVIGVILAFVLYKERGLALRLAGTSLITAGLVLIGLWGR
ncbi:MAG: hypothetical protein FJ279_00850 [Planctomycetes bacterium]|nr:hypothetical protein [Planctomycetota bacterium]MBM4081434.1 hypothetical protein [Planctomycetota bacterium]